MEGTNGIEPKRRRASKPVSEELKALRREIATEVANEIAQDILAGQERERITADDLLQALIEKLGLRDLP